MMKTFLNKSLEFFISVSFIFFFCISPAFAAPLKGFEATVVTVPKADLVMEPGSTQSVTMSFKNIGTMTWKKSGKSYVSLYTFAPKYRASIFRADNWADYTQAAVLKDVSVKPKKVGTMTLTLKAPIKEGDYKETFKLAAEDTTWIPGSEITFTIHVQEKAKVKPVETPLSAMLLLRSSKTVVSEAGQPIAFGVGIKNTGTATWKTRSIKPMQLAIASNASDLLAIAPTNVTIKSQGDVTPGGLDLINFTFNAPATAGSYTVRYQLAVDDVVVPDFFIDIPLEVTNGSPDALVSPVVVNPDEIPASQTISEPTLRIGVLIVDEELSNQVQISCDSPWNLVDEEGGLLANITDPTQIVEAFYKNKRYYFNRGQGLEQTYKYLRFVPVNKDAVCTVNNFDRRITRNSAFPGNQWRNILELRHNDTKDRTWLINELPMESYLAGLGETSDGSPHEFKKALVTVARTYAIYNWERATKHASEFFHMTAYADDQVYNGYNYEVRNPDIGVAAQETRGVTVNFQNATALTPYFSRSDGRTRDWSEVWGGSVAWLKSVPTPCDARNHRTLWGHGVGMSATEALCMAQEQGSTWKQIISYFYQGVDLQKRWQ